MPICTCGVESKGFYKKDGEYYYSKCHHPIPVAPLTAAELLMKNKRYPDGLLVEPEKEDK